jgi:hypothetical protein
MILINGGHGVDGQKPGKVLEALRRALAAHV